MELGRREGHRVREEVGSCLGCGVVVIALTDEEQGEGERGDEGSRSETRLLKRLIDESDCSLMNHDDILLG